MKLCIADPPYPPQFSERFDTAAGLPRIVMRSRARRWYGDGTRAAGDRVADFHAAAGEWDNLERHRELLDELGDTYDGWAIATTPDGLSAYEPRPVACRVMAWVKPGSTPTAHRIASGWEAVIVYPAPGRRGRRGPQVPDVLVAPAPRGVTFAGAKPEQWTRWVLDALGYNPDEDELHDMFPGSGSVARAAAQGVLL